MRAGALLLAVAACAWFALGIRQTRGAQEARSLATASGAPSPERAERTRAALDRAGFLNPDTYVDVLRAAFAMQQGRSADAQRRVLAITRREPENLEAWMTLALLTRDTAPATFQRAQAAIRHLSPPVPLP
jgi:predicted Zn-dependent protease